MGPPTIRVSEGAERGMWDPRIHFGQAAATSVARARQPSDVSSSWGNPNPCTEA